MKSPINYTLYFFLFVYLSACQKEAFEKPMPEPGYPTVYKPLSSSEWQTRNTGFQQINIHEGLSLNEYGFVEGEIQLAEFDSLNAPFVIENVHSILSRYRNFMGIPEDFEIDLNRQLLAHFFYISPSGFLLVDDYFYFLKSIVDGYWEERFNEITHEFRITQNKFEGERFLGPNINFLFPTTENKMKISGNWFPKIKLPKQDIITEERVYGILNDFMLSEFDRNIWEEKHKYVPKKIIYSVKNDNLISMHYCWHFSIPYEYEYEFTTSWNEIYIDTQTGEIVRAYIRYIEYM